MLNKKSQAALEFLMTYGWAILVVLVAVAALAYFGVLSPDRFLPAKCTLQAGIACLDFRVQADSAATPNGKVTVVLQNSLGFDLSSVVAKAGDCGNSGAGIAMENGEQHKFEIACVASSIITSGTLKYNKQLNVSYVVTQTTIDHTNLGQITSRVE